MSRLQAIAEAAAREQGVDQEERVSSGGSGITESGCYIAVVKMAKLVDAGSGAVGIAIELETEDGKKVRTTEWIQSGDAKGNKTTYQNKDGNTMNLPGFTQAKNINFLLSGVFGLPTDQEKQIKEYDWENKQEITVTRPVIVDWINKPIGICVKMTMEDKYNAETEFTTKPIIEHYYDPLTNQFGSEKIGSKEAENKDKFLESIAKNPVRDKRDKSKNSQGSSTSQSNASTSQTTTNVGF